MVRVWRKKFYLTYKLKNGVIVLYDRDVPLPRNFSPDPKLRSTVVFPPNTRAGDHYHTKREEVFIGFGEGMQLLIEDPRTRKVQIFDMDPSKNNGKCVAFWIETNTPHAVRNTGDKPGYLLEFASHPPEKVDYEISLE